MALQLKVCKIASNKIVASQFLAVMTQDNFQFAV